MDNKVDLLLGQIGECLVVAVPIVLADDVPQLEQGERIRLQGQRLEATSARGDLVVNEAIVILGKGTEERVSDRYFHCPVLVASDDGDSFDDDGRRREVGVCAYLPRQHVT
jgi:hypothetical protein